MIISDLLNAYRQGLATPRDVVYQSRAAALTDTHNCWISVLDESQLEPYLAALEQASPETHPLYGIPFAIKDNIDLSGVPTTAACPDFAYVPAERSATVVDKLIQAGAIPIGKNNLDQFATGLVGVRSPYGACHNAFDPAYISGGSSSGSAVCLALGQVAFSLGTDTAGSGRVPAAFNNLVGLKPSCGLLSTSGVVPACRSLDCVSIFALTPGDAALVLDIASGYDPFDAFSREFDPPLAAQRFGQWQGPTRLAVPQSGQLNFFGDEEAAALFEEAVCTWKSLGAEFVQVDISPLLAAARLLYEGPWVSERYLATRSLLETKPEAFLPVTRQIIEAGGRPSAVELFAAQYRLQELRQQAKAVFAEVDALLLPTCAGHFRIAEVEAEPIRLNSQLGTYTNFMNLLDCCAVATPVGFRRNGLPWGVTLCALAMRDRNLLSLAQRFAGEVRFPVGRHLATPEPAKLAPAQQGSLDILVCGAHLSGLPLNPQLTGRRARLKQATRTAPCYRLYALAGGPPYRPGLIRDAATGTSIDVEVWSVPAEHLGTFLAGIPYPLGLGKVELEDGQWVTGFICDSSGLDGAEEITAMGSWRRYLASSTGGTEERGLA